MPKIPKRTYRSKKKVEPITHRFLIEAAFRRLITDEELLRLQTGDRELQMVLEITCEKDPKRFVPKMTLVIGRPSVAA